MPAAGNIVGIFAYTSAAAGTSNTQTFTVVYDGAAQSLACSIAGSSQQQCCAVANNVTWNANQAASNSTSIACSTGATAVAVTAPSITSGTCGTSCSAHTVSVQVSNGGGSFTGSKTMVTLIWQPTIAGQAILFGNWHASLPGSSATYYCNLQGLCASSTTEAQFREIIPYFATGTVTLGNLTYAANNNSRSDAITLLDGGATEAPTCTLGNATGTVGGTAGTNLCYDGSDTFTPASLDLMDVQVAAGSGGTAPSWMKHSMTVSVVQNGSNSFAFLPQP